MILSGGLEPRWPLSAPTTTSPLCQTAKHFFDLPPRRLFQRGPSVPLFTMSATKTQSQKIFEKLKSKPANKASTPPNPLSFPLATYIDWCRYVLTVAPTIPPGPPFHLVSICVWTARLTTETLVFIFPLFAQPTLIVRLRPQ